MEPQNNVGCTDDKSHFNAESSRAAGAEVLRDHINSMKERMEPGQYAHYIRRMTELQNNDSWLVPIALDWAQENMDSIESCSNRKDQSLDGPELFNAKLGFNQKCRDLKPDEFSMVMLKVLLSRFQELKEQHDDGKDGKVWDRDGISDKDIRTYLKSHCSGERQMSDWILK